MMIALIIFYMVVALSVDAIYGLVENQRPMFVRILCKIWWVPYSFGQRLITSKNEKDVLLGKVKYIPPKPIEEEKDPYLELAEAELDLMLEGYEE